MARDDRRMNEISQREIDGVIQAIRSNPEYLDPGYVVNAYQAYGLEVMPDPFAEGPIAALKDALREQKPLSVIRIGDGEANLVTFGHYAGSETLDRYVVRAIVAMQQDRFLVDEQWTIVLRDLMLGAIAQADIIGVVGVWRRGRPVVERFVARFLLDHRAFCGEWRAVDYMLNLASRGALAGKKIASVRLYFSILEHLDAILRLAERIFIISDREGIVEKLRTRHPRQRIEFIAVGKTGGDSGVPPDRPTFLSATFSELPRDMRGCLCLIGAGIWAEFYCTWVKQRGGVAVDIGSGCDLLDGHLSRPIHKSIDPEKLQKYRL